MANGNVLVIGATGQTGRVAVQALAEDGWTVHAASRGGGRDGRWPGDVRALRLDREDDRELAAAVGDGCDVLVDFAAYGQEHARQLTGLANRIGSAVVISSVTVYEDDRGRSLETQGDPDGFPLYPVPIPESQRTLPPGDATYGKRKVRLERDLLAAGEALPVTLLRAGAIHGPYSRAPRELWFVQRVLDGRRQRVLAYGGRSRFHPAHVSNIAELIRLAALRPGSRVLNAADPQAPTTAEIGAAVDAVMGVRTETVLVEGPAPAGTVGENPWGTDRPIVLDMTAAERELGYRPVTGYAESLPETVAWLVGQLGDRTWQEAFPAMERQYAPFGDLFDYAAEDAWLKQRHEQGEQ
jgi:nucleoside-diphosphate-sugar epimerase